MYCMHCGKLLEDGEICSCQQSEDPSLLGSVDYPSPEPVKKNSVVLKRFASVLQHYFTQPVHAIGQAGQFGDWAVGLLCCLTQAVFIAFGFCLYLINRVQVGYRLGFFEQAIPFGQYLQHAGSNIGLLFLQLLGVTVLSDAILLFGIILFSGSLGRHGGISRVLGGVGTSLLMSGLAGILAAAIISFFPQTVAPVLFGGLTVSMLALGAGVEAGTELSRTKMFYLLPVTLLIWAGVMAWLIACIPMLSWIQSLLFS